MKPRHIVSLIIILLLSLESYASAYNFKHFDSSDGLPDSSITCAEEDGFGFMWFGTKDGLCRFNGQEFKLVQSIDGKADGAIQALCCDQSNRLWVAASSGLGYIDLMTGQRKSFNINTQGYIRSLQCDINNSIWLITNSEPCCISQDGQVRRFDKNEYFSANAACLDENGHIWFASNDNLIHQYDYSSNSFIEYELLPKGKSIRLIEAISEGGFLLSTTDYDVYRVFPKIGLCERIMLGSDYCSDSQIICIENLNDDEYMIGTDGGILQIDAYTLSINRLSSLEYDKLSLSFDNIRCIFMDSQERLWIGTFYSGINMSLNSKASYYHQGGFQQSIRGTTVRAICQDDSQSIWVGTEDGFLNRIDTNGNITCLSGKYGIPSKANYHSIISYRELIVIATYDQGLFFLDPKNCKILRHIIIPNAHCVNLTKTRRNELLVGTSSGLYTFQTANSTYSVVEGLERVFVHSLLQDSEGKIWIGSYGRGLYQMDANHSNVHPISFGDKKFPNLSITSIYEDFDGYLWLATEGNGLMRIDKSDSRSYVALSLTRDNGLPSNIICAISQSNDKLLWVSTNKGLFTLNTITLGVDRLIDEHDYIIGSYYRYGSCMMAKSGELLLGTTKGMVAFNPMDYRRNINADIYITDILASGSGKTRYLRQNEYTSTRTQTIKVKSKFASSLIFEFSTPASDGNQAIKYGYRLNNSLQSTTFDNSITFSNIRPGKTIFEVWVDGSTNAHKSVEIRVLSHPLASKLATVVYILIFCSISAYLIRRKLSHTKRERARIIEKLESEKQREIYDAKINFFTNITHEIRTPLSLIKMPIDRIAKQNNFSKEDKEDINIIRNNTNRLLSLTNQLLDFRKIESRQLQLNFIRKDICEILQRQCKLFTAFATEHHICFSTSIPATSINIMCAEESVEKIISNLLSNAFKYCKSEVIVSLLDMEDVVISIASDGDLIQEINRDRIFEPFFQERESKTQISGSKGTGLGLAFAKSLAELHNGSLFLDNKHSDKNVFILQLPKHHNGQIELPIEPKIMVDAQINEEQYDNKRHYILVAEDDQELNNYISRILSEDYNIIQAFNGDKALEIIKTRKVDLILSDIMMPGVSGCELCNLVKTNIDYSHIPILLVTAAVGMDNHLESLKVGADGYLEKPFEIDLLRASIANLFHNKELSFKQFTSSPLAHFNGLKINNMDDEYMDKLHSYIVKHLSDSELNVDALIHQMGTSKSTLFRKLKSNTGMNINEYIKLCRLKKAAELLSERKYRINEVVYLVGFSSPSYFSSMFQKQFGLLPSEFVKQLESKR